MKNDKFYKALLGSDDVYLTKNSIAVRKISSGGYKSGNVWMSDKTHYYKKTSNRLAQVKKVVGRVRYGR